MCNWCSLMTSVKEHADNPEDITLRGEKVPGGVMIVVYNGDRYLDSFGELPIVCLCGQHA